MNYGGSVNLSPGYYRAVFTGTTQLTFANGGWAEFAIHVWTSSGFGMTDALKTVSGTGVSERTLQYFRVDAPSQLLLFARVSTTCGTASVSGGALTFERVSD
jgi:hypothetical protein